MISTLVKSLGVDPIIRHPEERTYHTQPHTLIAVHQITQVLARSSNRDTFAISKFVKSALYTEVRFPVLTVSCWEMNYSDGGLISELRRLYSADTMKREEEGKAYQPHQP